MFLDRIFPYSKDKVFSILIACVFLVPLVFFNFTYEKFDTIKLALWAFLTGMALVVLVIKGEKYKIPKPAAIGLSAFLVLGLLDTLLSPDKIYSFIGKNYLWTGYFLFLVASGFFLLLISTLTKDKLEYVWHIILFTGVLNALWAILQGFGIGYYNIYSFDYLQRPPAFLGNTNFGGMFLAMIIPVAIYFCIVSKNFWIKVYYAVAVFFMIFGEMIFASRGGILALGLGVLALLIFAALTKNKKFFLFGFAVGALLAVLFAYITVSSRVFEFSSHIGDWLDPSRINIWSDALKVIGQHLWTGVGFGNFIGTGNYYDPHNFFLNWGLIGGAPMVLFWLVALTFIFFAGLRQVLIEKNLFLASLLSGFLAFLLASSFNPVSVACWLVFALIVVSIIFSTCKNYLQFPANWPTIIAGALMVLFAILFFSSEIFSFQSFKHPTLVKVATKLNPYSPAIWIGIENEIAQNADPNQIAAQIAKAQNLHPGEDLTQLRAGVNLFSLYEKTNDEKYFNSSIADVKAALAINNSVPTGKFYLAYEYFQHQDMAQAAVYAKKAVVYDPTDYGSWVLLANTYIIGGKSKQAILPAAESYKESFSIQLKHWLERLRRGQFRPEEVTPPIPTWS